MARWICVEAMENENADYCYGTERQYTRNGDFVFEWKPTLSQFWHNVPYPHATLGVRRDVLEKLGKYNTDCGYGGDYFLMIRLILENYKGIEIPSVISKYILGGISSQNESQATRYRTFFILAKRIQYIAKQFYPDITIEDCFNIYLFAKSSPSVFPRYFLLKLIRFMLDKKLKYFDYDAFINYVNFLSISRPSFTCQSKTEYKLFSFIPFLTVKEKSNIKRVYLFGFIPLLKIKSK